MVLADHALREIGNHDPAMVHEEARIEAALRLAEDVPHGGVPEKPSDLVLERSDSLKPEAALISGVLLPPEGPDDRIPDLRGHALAESVVREETRQGEDREPSVEECRERVPQDVFESRPPARSPDPAKSGEHPGDHEVRLILGHLGEEIQSHRARKVARVEVQHVARPRLRDRVQNLPGEVSMRIKETHTSPGIEVLEDEVPKQGALPRASLPDDVQVLRPVLGMQQNKLRVIRNPERPGADRDGGLVHRGGSARPLFPSPWGARSSLKGGTAEARAWRLHGDARNNGVW